MPVYEYTCPTSECGNHARRFDHYHRHFRDSFVPQCPLCAAPLTRLVSCPAIVWTKDYVHYNDTKREKHDSDKEAIHVWRMNSTRRADGEPEQVRLRTRSEVKAYCREEGLRMPDEMPTNAQISADGKKLSGAGMPGQWV